MYAAKQHRSEPNMCVSTFKNGEDDDQSKQTTDNSEDMEHSRTEMAVVLNDDEPSEQNIKSLYLAWDTDEVAEWICSLGFPQYKECFRTNFVSGKKLQFIEYSTLPQVGVQDYDHIKVIGTAVNNLLERPPVDSTVFPLD